MPVGGHLEGTHKRSFFPVGSRVQLRMTHFTVVIRWKGGSEGKRNNNIEGKRARVIGERRYKRAFAKIKKKDGKKKFPVS